MAELVSWKDRAKVHVLREACLLKHTHGPGEFTPSWHRPDSGRTTPKAPLHLQKLPGHLHSDPFPSKSECSH